MLTGLVEKFHHEVSTLDSAKNIMQVIESEKIELILLDIMMPDMSGIEALKLIRKKYGELKLPVILVTSKDTREDLVKGLKSGANDYITKPVDKGILGLRLQTFLKMKELSIRLGERQEKEAVQSMVATYNHEINNPLTVAMAALNFYKKSGERENLERIEESLNRMKEIVKKIEELTENSSNQKTEYSQKSKIYKID